MTTATETTLNNDSPYPISEPYGCIAVIGDDHDVIPVARVEPVQEFVVPPECQGQMVEYAYSYDYVRGWIIERRKEAGYATTYRAYEEWDRYDDFEPWCGRPRLGNEVGLVELVGQ